jgi:hypothetical protein
MTRSPKSPVNLPSSDTKAPVTEPGAVREVSFRQKRYRLS